MVIEAEKLKPLYLSLSHTIYFSFFLAFSKFRFAAEADKSSLFLSLSLLSLFSFHDSRRNSLWSTLSRTAFCLSLSLIKYGSFHLFSFLYVFWKLEIYSLSLLSISLFFLYFSYVLYVKIQTSFANNLYFISTYQNLNRQLSNFTRDFYNLVYCFHLRNATELKRTTNLLSSW